MDSFKGDGQTRPGYSGARRLALMSSQRIRPEPDIVLRYFQDKKNCHSLDHIQVQKSRAGARKKVAKLI